MVVLPRKTRVSLRAIPIAAAAAVALAAGLGSVGLFGTGGGNELPTVSAGPVAHETSDELRLIRPDARRRQANQPRKIAV